MVSITLSVPGSCHERHLLRRFLQDQTLQVHRNLWQNFCSACLRAFLPFGHQLIEMALKESTCANATPQNLDLDLLLCGEHEPCQRNVWFAESLDETGDQQHSFCRLQPGPSFTFSCEHCQRGAQGGTERELEEHN